jgi:hypothetical protein
VNAKREFSVTVAEAALLLTVASWALVFVYWFLVRDTPVDGGITVAAVVVVPGALATWWIFRRLRVDRPGSAARRAATAFAVSAPLTLAIAYGFGELMGGCAEGAFGSRSVLPAVATLVIVLMILLPGTVVAWALHPSGGAVPVGESGQDEHR